MCSRVLSATKSGRVSALETVPGETAAALATSCNVEIFFLLILGSDALLHHEELDLCKRLHKSFMGDRILQTFALKSI